VSKPAGTDPAFVDPDMTARRGIFVGFLVTATWVLFISMIGLLFYKWANAREPSSFAMVQLSDRYAGATIIVENVLTGYTLESIASPQFDSSRFFLEPGGYNLKILSAEDKKVIYEIDFTMPPDRGIRIDPFPEPPATQPGIRAR
jgi:hypothetical protein